MITRPLELSSKLRPEPRSFDGFFLVNAGLIAVFFSTFGSKFVLSPAVGVDFRLPEIKGANAGARVTTHHITITDSGQIFGAGVLTMPQLREWLRVEAKTVKSPTLEVQASKGVPLSLLSDVVSAANEAGFFPVITATEPKAAGGGR
jgi:biopolymer transport protein ExbD